MRRYYTPKGEAIALRPYKFLGVRNGKRRVLTFVAPDRTTAAGYALAWGRRRGYKMYRRRKSGTGRS